jgi:DNA polymerase
MDPIARRKITLSALAFWADMGGLDEADDGIEPSAPDDLAGYDKPAPPPPMNTPAAAVPLASPRPLQTNPIGEARKAAAASNTLGELERATDAFTLCPLRHTARRTVFCDGAQGGPVMLIGEAPGAEEDATGKPFVGPSGRLLDRMLAAIGLHRSENVYITNVVYWRPPGNRDPSLDEIAICRPFLLRQIELLAPRLILTAGKPAAQAMLGVDEGIMKLRGRELSWGPDGAPAAALIPLIPLLHPSYLLRRPQEKARAWDDLRRVADCCDRLGIARPSAL